MKISLGVEPTTSGLEEPALLSTRLNTIIAITNMSGKTRTVRGSDYSPAVELSEQKDKLVTENWRD